MLSGRTSSLRATVLVLWVAAAVLALAVGAWCSPVVPKTDANNGLDGDNPYFQRWNIARACEDGSNRFWYSSSFRLPGEPDGAEEQWVDYRPPLAVLGPGRYRISAKYRQTASRAGYDALYIVHHEGGTMAIPRSQFGYTTEYVSFDLGEFDLGSTGWVRVQDTGSGLIAFDEMSFTYLGPAIDTQPPSVPTGVQAAVLTSSAVRLTWTASTDNVGVGGYRVFRDAIPCGQTSANAFTDSGLSPLTTHSYTVSAFDLAGNESARSTPAAQATTPALSRIVFDFDDQGSASYTYTSSPNTFYTAAEGPDGASRWFGKRNVPSGDGLVYWGLTSGSSNYGFGLSSVAGDGSLTIRTSTPAGQTGSLNGAAYVATNDFGNWFRWTKDGDYYRGVLIEADARIVGDANGWCAAYGSLPAVPPCAWSSDLLHQGSDWGSTQGNRAMLYVSVAKDQDLTEPGFPAGTGSTGDGVAYWISVQAGVMADPSDDLVRMQSHTYNYDHGTFRLKDGLGLGLVPEDGSGCRGPGGSPYLRNGIIEGSCNRVVLTVGLLNAGGNDEYFDIWITRPDGTKIHLDPLTCDWVDSDQNAPNKPGFGADGHTVKITYSNKDSTKSILRLGSASVNGIWGIVFDQVSIRNDWDGRVETRVSRLSDLRGMPSGSRVSIDSTGGEKIAVIGTQSADGLPPYYFHIEQADRTTGLRVVNRSRDPQPVKGCSVSASGVLSRDAAGNLCLDVTDGHCTFGASAAQVTPLGIGNRAASGLDCTGLLVRAWGRGSEAVPGGSGNVRYTLDDGSSAPIECTDYSYDGLRGAPTVGEYWSVIGVVTLELRAGVPSHVIVVDEAARVDE